MSYKYNRYKNVRVRMSDMVVERLYVTKSKRGFFGLGRIVQASDWRVVDYHHTHSDRNPRPCPMDKLYAVLKLTY